MDKMSKRNNNIDRPVIAGYHGSHFDNHYYFIPQRYLPLNPDYSWADSSCQRIMKGVGVELETQCWGLSRTCGVDGFEKYDAYASVLKNCVFDCFGVNRMSKWRFEQDGSLRSNCNVSAECVSAVFSVAAFRNEYHNFKELFDVQFPRFGIDCTMTGDCGMHVNLSNGLFGTNAADIENNVRKLGYILNKATTYDFWCRMVNRSLSRTGYCARMSYFETPDKAKRATLYGLYSDHYCSFNLGHFGHSASDVLNGRVELRLVGGQKNYACFRNSMETVFHIVDRVKKLSWADCDDLEKIFSGCNQYVLSRLERCKNENYLDIVTYERIKATSKTVDFGDC